MCLFQLLEACRDDCIDWYGHRAQGRRVVGHRAQNGNDPEGVDLSEKLMMQGLRKLRNHEQPTAQAQAKRPSEQLR